MSRLWWTQEQNLFSFPIICCLPCKWYNRSHEAFLHLFAFYHVCECELDVIRSCLISMSSQTTCNIISLVLPLSWEISCFMTYVHPLCVCLASHSFFLWIIFLFHCEPVSPEEFQQRLNKKNLSHKNSGLVAQVFIWKICSPSASAVTVWLQYLQACTYMYDVNFSWTSPWQSYRIVFFKRWVSLYITVSLLCVHLDENYGIFMVKGSVWWFLLRHTVQRMFFEEKHNNLTYCHLM